MSEIKTLADLTPDKRNARRHNPRNVGMIERALGEVGAARSIVVDENGVILAGNATVEAAANAGIERVQVVDGDGETLIAVRRTGLTPEQKRKLALYDNRTAELADWDAEVLAELKGEDFDFSGAFADEELSEILSGIDSDVLPDIEHIKLTERFIIPPFDVLDSRQGYWQERKRAWLALGIYSELGRGENANPGGLLRPAASLGANGHTVRGDGKGRPLERERERERVVPKMAMRNDPMQRKAKYSGESIGKT